MRRPKSKWRFASGSAPAQTFPGTCIRPPPSSDGSLPLLLLAALLPLCLLSSGLLPGPDARAAEDDGVAAKKAALLLRMQVNRAIKSGARWIADHQHTDGSFRLSKNNPAGPFPSSRHRFGISALCFYTLADCGYDAEHEAVKKALAYLLKHYRQQMKGDYWTQASAYSLSLLVLGLHDLYVTPARRSQLDQRDRYGSRRRTEKNPCGYPKRIRKLIEDVLDWLMANQAVLGQGKQARRGLFRYPDGFNQGGAPPGMPASHMGPEDLSNTQYVLLALWAGSRCGYEIPVETLEAIAARLLEYQERGGPQVARVPDPKPRPPGAPGAKKKRYADPAHPPKLPPAKTDQARGFPYTLGREMTGSMTTAGLSSLAIVKAMLLERNALKPGLRTQLDRGIWDAIAWLTHNYDLESNPGAPGRLWQYYYLYGLERACVILGKRYLGAHDWYAEGARLFVDAQENDGSWKPAGQLGHFGAGPGGASPFRTDVLDTCFALLFLKRATIVPKIPILEGPVTTPSAK